MSRHTKHSAFSIVELLIAIIIIGVLSSILVPVLGNRAADARISSCKAELEHIADGQERMAIQLGYYGRLYLLDDLPGGDGTGLGMAGDSMDGIADEPQNQLFSRPNTVFIDPRTNDFVSSIVSQQILDTLDENTTGTTSARSQYIWGGPYITIHRDEDANESDDGTVSGRPRMHDIPNDPWGNDYLFFVRGGVIFEPNGTLSQTITIGGQSFDATVFDRPTILSTGADGMPGDNGTSGFSTGDDLYRSFGY